MFAENQHTNLQSYSDMIVYIFKKASMEKFYIIHWGSFNFILVEMPFHFTWERRELKPLLIR